MRLLVGLHANSFNFWCDISPRLSMFVDYIGLLLNTLSKFTKLKHFIMCSSKAVCLLTFEQSNINTFLRFKILELGK